MNVNIEKLDTYCLGNALEDVLMRISEEEFATLGFKRNESRLFNLDQQNELLARLEHLQKEYSSGGSSANSAKIIAQLGGQVAFSGIVGDDFFGEEYIRGLQELEIVLGNPFIIKGRTGTSVVLITPDGDRTMRVALGAATRLNPEHVNPDAVRVSRAVFIEGYLLGNGPSCQEAVLEAIRAAKQFNIPIAASLSSEHTVAGQRSLMEQLVGASALVIANAKEAMELTGAETWQDAFDIIRSHGKNALVSNGAQGALIGYDNLKMAHVPAFKTKLIDTTGAGDALAGGFLYGIQHGLDPVKATQLGCEIASKVIARIGAGLPLEEFPDLKKYY